MIAYAELDGQLALFCQDFFEQSELSPGPVIVGAEGIHYMVTACNNHFGFIINRLNMLQCGRETFGGVPVRVDMDVGEMSEPDGAFSTLEPKGRFCSDLVSMATGVRCGQCQSSRSGTC